jgi:hypothetical protein
MEKWQKLLAKLQPYKGPDNYVSDPYSQEDLAKEVSDASMQLSPEDIKKILDVESSGGTDLQNPLSSAKGNFQVIDSTRAEALKRLKEQGIGEIPVNPLRQDALLMKNIVNDTENVLLNSQKGPIEPSLENVYLAHHFGKQGALNAINNPNLPLSKERLRRVKYLMSRKPLTTIDVAKPAKNILELNEEE